MMKTTSVVITAEIEAICVPILPNGIKVTFSEYKDIHINRQDKIFFPFTNVGGGTVA